MRRERSFQGIVKRFLEQFAWCIGWGIVLRLAHRFGNAPLRQTVEHIFKEHPAPVSFNAIGTVALTVLGGFVAFGGRTQTPLSAARDFLCYRPAELALSLAAVFFGLSFGLASAHVGAANAQALLGATPAAMISLAAMGFFFPVLILVVLWASFENAAWPDERTARLVAGTISLVGVGVFWYAYCTTWRLCWLPISN